MKRITRILMVLCFLFGVKVFGCPETSGITFSPGSPVPIGTSVKATVDVTIPGNCTIKYKWSGKFSGNDQTSEVKLKTSGPNAASVSMDWACTDRETNDETTGTLSTSATIIAYKVSGVTADETAIPKDSTSSIGLKAIIEPSGLPEADIKDNIEWQYKKDNGGWNSIEENGITKTLDSGTVGKFVYAAKAGANDAWADSDDLYVFDIKVTPAADSIIDGNPGAVYSLDIKPIGISVTDISWDWYVNKEKVITSPIYTFNISFNNKTDNKSTTVNAKWYAYPDNPCTATTNPAYGIFSKMKVDNTDFETDNAVLNVWAPPGGSTTVAIIGDPQYGEKLGENGKKIYYVNGTGNLERKVTPIKTAVNCTTKSLFYNKIKRHEEVHIAQFATGNWKDYMLVSGYYDIIKILESSDLNDLKRQVALKWSAYYDSEWAKINVYEDVNEKEAYSISDNIDPKFVFQSSCR